jgi:hypothetical protein
MISVDLLTSPTLGKGVDSISEVGTDSVNRVI